MRGAHHDDALRCPAAGVGTAAAELGYLEDTRYEQAKRTYVPLGVVCVMDSPADHVGPQTVRLQSWPDTVVWLSGAGLALVALGVALAPTRRRRARPAAGGSHTA